VNLPLTAPAALPAQHEPFLAHFGADLARYFVYFPSLTFAGKLRICLRTDGIWALFAYRLGRALASRRRGVLGSLGWALFEALETAVRILTGIHLDVDAAIGPGFYVGHHGSIVVGPGVRIGRNCNIGQMALVAQAGPEGRRGAPSIGDRVFLGAGCKVLGGVTVQDGAAIGANAVVLDDVARNAVMVGVPARVVGYGGSRDHIYLGEGHAPGDCEAVLATNLH
jgi:serine O-acetyltransferase